ncbi:hypothetical protein BDR26DRAFT_852780 [Obelidium mucronatum]|nr:hypothetical protein BDR26DRAFT_852780 [Obelidium mucronatum]
MSSSLSGQRTPRGHLGQEVLEEVFVSTMDHINADHPPGGTPMASPPTQRSKDRRLSADHVINHSRRSSGGSMATIRQEDVSATKEAATTRLFHSMKIPNQLPKIVDGQVTVRCLQIVCTTAVFFAFSTSLSFKFSEPITQKLLIYVIMTTGTINVILLLATLIMEIRFLLNGPAPGLKRGRTESAKENHHSNPIMHGSGRHGASPSVRAVVNANVMTGLRSDVTGGKSEFSTARSH